MEVVVVVVSAEMAPLAVGAMATAGATAMELLPSAEPMFRTTANAAWDTHFIPKESAEGN